MRATLGTVGAHPGTAGWGAALDQAEIEKARIVGRLRDREAAAATSAAPLALLDRKGIRARDWLAALHGEADAPVSLMMEDGRRRPTGTDRCAGSR